MTTTARYVAKADAVHRRYYGVWDTEKDTWVTAEGLWTFEHEMIQEPVYAAGIPMWNSLAGAEAAIAMLNKR